jgi:excisionase family DNA binding protein
MKIKRWVLGCSFLLLATANPGFAAEAEVMTLEEAAAFLRLPPETVRQLAETQRIPARSVGETWRFSRPALVEWLKGEDLASIRGRQAPAGAPTVGEPRTGPTAEEIALRDQAALLKRGATTIDFGVAYVHREQTPVPGSLRIEERTTAATAALRYGLVDNLQVTLRLPYIWRRAYVYADASVSGTTEPSVTRDDYTGDASASLLFAAMRERTGRPNIIVSLDGVLGNGPGDKAIGGGIVLSKSYDPAVLFAGVNYLHGNDIDPADPRRSLAKHNWGLNLGYTYALNDSLALNTVVLATYRDSESPDGSAIPPPRERYALQLGTTWMLARGLFVEPTVSMRLGGDGADFGFALNIPYSF